MWGALRESQVLRVLREAPKHLHSPSITELRCPRARRQICIKAATPAINSSVSQERGHPKDPGTGKPRWPLRSPHQKQHRLFPRTAPEEPAECRRAFLAIYVGRVSDHSHRAGERRVFRQGAPTTVPTQRQCVEGASVRASLRSGAACQWAEGVWLSGAEGKRGIAGWQPRASMRRPHPGPG